MIKKLLFCFLLSLCLALPAFGSGDLDLRVERGTTFIVELTWKDENDLPIDLTGYAAKLQVRKESGSNTVILEASVVNGKIVLGGAAGTITITIIDTETSALPLKFAQYDLLMTAPGGNKTRLVEGAFNIVSEITQ